ncbi:hypothetical protein CFR72_13045 [Gluconacetobacter entanii]|uniref:Uncharacterized protein n=1 Tax=Gluconacetobacter entanii TaxID=108528 RepID=A0A318PPA7_9PROT|nr:hypothetical protein CFR72_13045 [Gluconacetobacter entanii]
MRSMGLVAAAAMVVAVRAAAAVPVGDAVAPVVVAGMAGAAPAAARVAVAGVGIVAAGAVAGIAVPAGVRLIRITVIPAMVTMATPDITATPMAVGVGAAGADGKFRSRLTGHGAASCAAPWQV